MFRHAIKTYGYYADLNDKQMRQVSREILLDYDTMLEDPKSAFALTYMSPFFMTDLKRHQVRELLRLGWFLCKHNSIEE
jgi:hypothetical protein